MNEAELELKMDDLGASGNDKGKIRFAHAWWKFKARFKSGHLYTAGDVYDAFEAGVAHGKQYEASPVKYLEPERIDGPKGDEQKEQKTARIIIWWELNDGSQNIETDKPEMTGAEIMEAAKNRGWLRPWQKILVEMLPNGTNRIIGQSDAIRLHQFMKFSAIGNDDND